MNKTLKKILGFRLKWSLLVGAAFLAAAIIYKPEVGFSYKALLSVANFFLGYVAGYAGFTEAFENKPVGGENGAPTIWELTRGVCAIFVGGVFVWAG